LAKVSGLPWLTIPLASTRCQPDRLSRTFKVHGGAVVVADDGDVAVSGFAVSPIVLHAFERGEPVPVSLWIPHQRPPCPVAEPVAGMTEANAGVTGTATISPPTTGTVLDLRMTGCCQTGEAI
jgi:hypothetical protein